MPTRLLIQPVSCVTSVVTSTTGGYPFFFPVLFPRRCYLPMWVMFCFRVDFQVLFCGAFPLSSLQGHLTGVQGTAIRYCFSCQSHFPSSSVERGKAQTLCCKIIPSWNHCNVSWFESCLLLLFSGLCLPFIWTVWFLWLFLCLFSAAVDNNNMIKFQLWLLQHKRSAFIILGA